MAERDDPCSFGQDRFELIEPRPPVIVDVDDSDSRAGLPGGSGPRQQIGRMLGDREHDFVAGLEIRPPHVLATRLMPSVVPRTKMISVGSAALTNRATV